MNFQSDKPYPEVKVERKNLEYAKILLQDYAGSLSEETAVHLYLYQHLTLDDDALKELSLILRKIAIVEMHHLSLLGKTIKLLGLDPKFGAFAEEEFVFWSGKNVSYPSSIKEMLEVDIERESNAILNYKIHRSMIDDKYIKKLIDRIIEDEKIHLDIFHYYYQKLCFLNSCL